MSDRENVIKSIKACAHHPNHDCESCGYCSDNFWCFNDQLIEDFETMMRDQEEERRNIVHWLGKFCAYLDFKDECWTYEENLEFFRKKMKEQFGWEVTE